MIEVTLEEILLELYINIEYLGKKKALKIAISDDGETILFSETKHWIETEDLDSEIYSIKKIDKEESKLGKLLGKRILDIQFGIGKESNGEDVIYYVMIKAVDNNCLFFNNGDEGKYVFDEIEAILADNIYQYRWERTPPSIIL
ncbi:hypothetical protein [Capnocytophaga cynodegmi]|uniref:hypothetical protein n=1 Tax=Capnocytophaga cynodegmi TaxID=28189 RepID=UPI001E501580|nr:hypothetical protein [Capnocytophaga cynodegmi]